MTKMTEFKGKTPKELHVSLNDLLREQLKLRLKKTNGDLTDTSMVKKVRKDIARVLTLLGGC
jgi:large subunit ribosomal protein L29